MFLQAKCYYKKLLFRWDNNTLSVVGHVYPAGCGGGVAIGVVGTVLVEIASTTLLDTVGTVGEEDGIGGGAAGVEEGGTTGVVDWGEAGGCKDERGQPCIVFL